LSNIIKSENKDKKYSPPSGAEKKRLELANIPEGFEAVYDQETGEFIKVVKTKKGMKPLDSFF
tara:strand:+ start:3581 stop:3769 length:189 start_codon:yes stop_codon:yes gene_type:complete